MFFNYLNRVQTFIAVVDCGSFTRAAERLFISKAMASIHVKSLEEVLNVPLLIRNTRGITLTEAGEVLYNDFQEIFANIQTSIENISESHHSLSGTLSITSTAEFGEQFLMPLIGEFCKLHPRLDINYYADSSLNDLISDRLDLAIRLGTLRNSALKSRKLGNYSVIMVASSEWLKNNSIQSLNDLNSAPWIANSNLPMPTQWALHNDKHGTFDLRAVARFHSNSALSIKAMVRAGLGISILPEWLVKTEIAKGELIQLFPDYTLPKQDITIVFVGDHRIRLKCRVFIDYLMQNLHL
ncbi:LysR family transcriptional regulator [Xenorhabdus szentirmaii]|uniref:Transcriptional regulator, LysR family n=2 Tax=Xenorhabdus szentirmaii TaxID=290112 RepID=W1J6S5_9GAMM|nr:MULTISPECIES: LysR family transcriptional regulator [Xenorhabdus]MBD2782184.1 LysR family transcriptional regulator [Xenorhabdus sp. 38]MBD2793816.1 LysR family transcriptional regulator [Xenorhabdus sp. CUL]MBD2801111.1 LysR family transcriptional regulator [Xenorhabdus sp. M]MBD2805531.1 LysR family transcriptional regulator [Xenorhabdus sp. ZM]MBD2821679.1 LysR family transcriptional regulator [Xenorhabdus sp. 42]